MAKEDWGLSKIQLGPKLARLGIPLDPVPTKIKKIIRDLTYDECDDFATELANAGTGPEAMSILEDHWNRCTLNVKVPGKDGKTITWAKRCEIESKFSR